MSEEKTKATFRGVLSEWVKTRRSTPWRKNVLVLVGFGYFVLLVIFVGLIWAEDLSAEASYEFIEAPLMALVGGSLAIAKDLINLDRDSEEKPTPENIEGEKP